MLETIVQFFGMGFVGLILCCVVFTFGGYIVEDIKLKRKKWKRLSKWLGEAKYLSYIHV